MARRYTEVEHLVKTVRELRKQGKTYGEIAGSTGLEKRQVKKLMERQRKEAKDQWLVYLVVACQQQSRQTYGSRRVRRWIQRQIGKLVNIIPASHSQISQSAGTEL